MEKTVLITGASKGIGRALAKVFAENGYSLILIARTLEALESLQNELREKYRIKVDILSVDLCHKNAIETIIQTFATQLKNLGILINNAGFGILSQFDHMKAQDVNDMIDLNIKFLTELTYRILPFMLANKTGKILNVASIAAYIPGPHMAMYYASKAYVLSFSEALYEEYKSQGILVSTLCPGLTPTSFQLRAGIDESGLTKHQIPVMSAERVAEIAYAGLQQNKRVIITGLINKLSVFLMRIFPRGLCAKIAEKIFKGRSV